MRHITLTLAVAITLHLFLACTLVSGSQLLRATRPQIVATTFKYGDVTGAMYSEPSLFGLPNYQAQLQGQLKADSNPANSLGCQPYAPGFAPFSQDPKQQKLVIAFAQRGNCSFGTKALMAQQAQASAIIVWDNTMATSLPKMAGGTDTPNINIPGMFITQKDGRILQKLIQDWEQAAPSNSTASEVWVSLSYSLLAPDDRVEFDFFTYPDEPTAKQFVTEFADVIPQLGNSVMFTPHMRIIDGEAHGCWYDGISCDKAFIDGICGNQCTNCGRYCRIDPDGNLDTRPNGLDQVREAALAKCVYEYSLQKDLPLLWWQFTNKRQNDLKCIESANYDPQCSIRAMEAVGIPNTGVTGIINCTGMKSDDIHNEDYTNPLPNDLLEAELEWFYDWGPLTSPYLFVNNMTYFGKFGCPAPAAPSTCGPLSMICAGFAAGTGPAICGVTTTDTCENGATRDACGICGGTAVDDSHCDTATSKFPIGPVIGVAIVCCILIAGAVYWYMRRQNSKMRDDIDSLLKQYLPLDGQTSSSNGKRNGATKDTQSNLRLIGNLETSDEATDL